VKRNKELQTTPSEERTSVRMKGSRNVRATSEKVTETPMEFLEHFEIVPRQQVAFYLPCYDAIGVPAHIEAIEKGDVAKICMRTKPQGPADQAYSFRTSLKLEVTSVQPDCLDGRVNIGPLNLSWVGGPNLPHGTPIQVRHEAAKRFVSRNTDA
jgi:hypothetical protein